MFTRRTLIWVLTFIFLANFFNYMDRSLVSALEKQLRDKEEGLGLTKSEFGLLWTLFTIGYMVCAIPIGLLADRYSRTRIFAFCVVVWSLATIASGLARAKMILFVARVFIGVGEAGCLVIGPSLISDYFRPRSRGRALAVFYVGMPLGGTAAFIVAALLLDFGWRNLFYLAGVPGFVIGPVIWLMRDPPRGASEALDQKDSAATHEPAIHAHGHAGGSFKEYFRLLGIPTLILIILAQAFAVIILVPLMHFGVEFFESARGMSGKKARLLMGVMALVAGLAGNIVAGLVGDRLFKRTKAAYSLIAGIGYLAAFPCLYIGFTATEEPVFVGALGLGAFFIFLCMPAVNTQIANVAPAAQRATAWALAVMILHLLGDTLSPPVFGHLVDEWKFVLSGGENAANEKAFVWFSFAMIPAALCCFLATLTAARDTERAMTLQKP